VPAEDRLAFFRDTEAFRCVWLVELPNGDFATTVVRLAVFAAWRLALLEGLCASPDPVLAAVAAKGVKEVRYHRDYAARWVLTLAGGTDDSRQRTDRALAEVWPHTSELSRPDPVTAALVDTGVVPDSAVVWGRAADYLGRLLSAAALPAPDGSPGPDVGGGREGRHSGWLPPLLGELQGLARQHPMARW
jgi:ring-1,2-phenylacetyl-CoA epoxidase subunit PaaC